MMSTCLLAIRVPAGPFGKVCCLRKHPRTGRPQDSRSGQAAEKSIRSAAIGQRHAILDLPEQWIRQRGHSSFPAASI